MFKTQNVCPECNGVKGKDGLTGYWIENAYDENARYWLTCEFCKGSGVQSPFTFVKDLDDLIEDELLLSTEAGNA